jgi:hypothetical protein
MVFHQPLSDILSDLSDNRRNPPVSLGRDRDPLVADVEQDLKSSGPQRRNSLSYHPMGEGRV